MYRVGYMFLTHQNCAGLLLVGGMLPPGDAGCVSRRASGPGRYLAEPKVAHTDGLAAKNTPSPSGGPCRHVGGGSQLLGARTVPLGRSGGCQLLLSSATPGTTLGDQHPGDCGPVGWWQFRDHLPPLGLGQVEQQIGDHGQSMGLRFPPFVLAGASPGASA